MNNERFYRGVFYTGGAWNFLASIPTFFLVGSLPGIIGIEDPKYPIFIYFNLMTMFLFGLIHFTVVRHLATARPFVKILLWSKILTVLIFLGGILMLSMPSNLISFLAPGITLDLILGFLFWRYLFVTGASKAVVTASS